MLEKRKILSSIGETRRVFECLFDGLFLVNYSFKCFFSLSLGNHYKQ